METYLTTATIEREIMDSKLYKVVLSISNGSKWAEEVWAYTMDDAAKKATSECPYKVIEAIGCEALDWNPDSLGRGV